MRLSTPAPRTIRIAGAIVVLSLFHPASGYSQTKGPPRREILPGIATTRPVLGAPYELRGNRIVFLNWYYIQPGDLDWRNADGKSVYVSGDSGLFEARHVGINAPRGIRIRAQKPVVQGPLFRPHRMILRDGNLFKGWTDSDYYESSDAIHWEKKARIGVDDLVKDGLYQVFVDPASAAEERFKAVWVGEIDRAQFEAFRAARPGDWEPHAIFLLGEKDHVACLRGSTSPDGIHWKTQPEPLVVEYCDTWNTAYYDAALREYVIYTRYWSVGPQSEQLPPDLRNSWTGLGRRAIGRSAAKDFRRFSPSEMILEPSADMLPSEQLYTNCRTAIPGAPDQHLMFPTIWNGSVDDTTRIAMAASHDGKLWHWVPGGELLKTPPFGRWDGGCIWATPDLIELPNGDWALPYIANNVPHKYPRGKMTSDTGYAVWHKGRLCALEAEEVGEFTLIPIVARGSTLKINAVTKRTGWVKVELLGVDGRSLAECQPITGDQHWATVTWKQGSSLNNEKFRPVTLRIELKQGQLFGLQFD
ncbi:MAG: hypothetical protein HY290_32480 [Planctomycetia bacterium]|nr:hypothetical protein [Planctomycetia bacterium]